jgi:oxygen-independent coproporphyrinogen-3 oxidase
MNQGLLAKYSGAVPRYTSYPTAPHFHEGIGNDQYGQWLKDLPHDTSLSLYVHIPYCDRLCWFCACHTRHTLKYEPVSKYLSSLAREIDAVAARVPRTARVTALHLGGGSPTMLQPKDMVDLAGHLKRAFKFAANAEISVEMDPNDLDEGRYDALAAIGMTRASLGVQDFEPKVQQAINRIQTFEQTRSVVEAVRARGVRSVNCDILYGLPYQTVETVERTVNDILSLDPDRIALFGYAHVPWMKKHQTMIDEAILPDVRERYAQMTKAAERLVNAGYEPIGIDHFAKPADSLAVAKREGRLHRNFQGYTQDSADALIGLGASSISRLPQGYVQNVVATGSYQRMVGDGGLAAVRGIALTQEDRLRAYAIERIMCDFSFSFADVRRLFPDLAETIIAEARSFAANNRDGICCADLSGFHVAPAGRPVCRSIAAVFDTYLNNGRGRHSIAV